MVGPGWTWLVETFKLNFVEMGRWSIPGLEIKLVVIIVWRWGWESVREGWKTGRTGG